MVFFRWFTFVDAGGLRKPSASELPTALDVESQQTLDTDSCRPVLHTEVDLRTSLDLSRDQSPLSPGHLSASVRPLSAPVRPANPA